MPGDEKRAQDAKPGQTERREATPSSGPSRASASAAAPEQAAAPSLLPAISVPKGGGAIKGIGEKFAANPVTGTGSMTIPIAVSPGRSGFGPQLALSYDSGAGNGPFGFGWSLSIPKISRKTDKGLPQYLDATESDVFLISGAEDLVPVLRPDGKRYEDSVSSPGFTIHRYRPRIEGLFARIERWTETASGDVHWRSITRENITSLYGRDNRSRIFDPADGSDHPSRIFEWFLCASYDDKGNALVYEYAAENDLRVNRIRPNERNRLRSANRYLKRIKYGNHTSRLVQPDLGAAEWLFEVVFDYDEGHFEELPLSEERPADEQHRYVRASAESDGSWAERPDPFSSYRSGFEIRTYRRCRRVLMFHRFDELGPAPVLVRSTEFDYQDLDLETPVPIEEELAHQGSTRFASFIRRVVQSGYVRAPDENEGNQPLKYLRKSLPPLEFEYSKARIQDEVRELDEESRANLPQGVDGSAYQWVDLDGEGLSGVLTQQGGAWHYKPNLGGGMLGPLQTLRTQPSLFAQAAGGEQLLDLSGDGQLDAVAFAGPAPGFYERTPEGEWASFTSFRQLPNVRWDDPNLRFVDLDGDGHADIFIAEDEVFTWHPSLAEEGFGPGRRIHVPRDEERGPRLVLADGTQSVYLADFSGDGLTDLVRIRNGEVCYWPNLGYGRFGAKVTMDNSPWFDNPDQFDQRRIRLADIDGSGTTDILYLHRDGVRIFFNQSGNRWSEARHLRTFPRIDNLTAVTTADLLGNGTACLVWSSPLPADAGRPLRYIDLMGGQKPHLLVRSTNNLGAETCVQYVASTKFYLADKAAGRPWITRLPFPVHVIERVETFDRISRNRFVTRYRYHHGYFDGQEREFRGFGMVEQFDTEEFAALSRSDQFPTGDNVDGASHVPPVLAKTWFHTGAFLDREHISDYFAGLRDASDAGEYFREPGLDDTAARDLLLDDTILPDGLTVEEQREACRALKGSMLRQEVYALDGSDKEVLPYTVSERSYGLRRIQERRKNRHAVFLALPREEIAFNYERTRVPVVDGRLVDAASAAANPDVQWLLDPRVAHSLTLEVDDFGNVLKSASIGYGRRFIDPSLPERARADQTKTHVTYSEYQFTNELDEPAAYRAPVAYQARTYELTGYTPSGPAGRYAQTDFLGASAGGAALTFDMEIPYEEQPTTGRQRRLIEHVRTVFRANNLTKALRLGQLESLALPYEAYKLAFTPGLVAQVFGDRVTDEMLAGTGGIPGGCYVHTRDESDEPDSGWWIPSGRVFYSEEQQDEQDFACAHFFLPHRARDPFHSPALRTDSHVKYDGYDLLLAEATDPLENRIQALELDYRTLQPACVTDPNGNRTKVRFDALGMVVGTAVMGKPDEALGDELDGAFQADLTDAQIAGFLADPKGPPAAELLGKASTRIVYDYLAYSRDPDPSRRNPAVAATLARETHVHQAVPPGGLRIQVAFSYSDGFGREIQKKVQAEPGPVPTRDQNGAFTLDADGQPLMTSGAANPRWVASGWTVFNNKGKPVRQYEPYFTDTHRFELDVRVGKSPILFYDPLARVIGKLLPDHTWEKVIFDAWRQTTWDVTDTLLITTPDNDPDVGAFFARLPRADYLPTWHRRRVYGDLRPDEQAAAKKSEIFAATPTIAHADSLGRPVATVVHNRYQYSKPEAAPPTEERYTTYVLLDIEGNQREIFDAKDRLVARYHSDMLGNRIHQASMEAGERWMLGDVTGKPLYAWSSRGFRFRTTYDALRRPVDTFLSDHGAAELLVGRSVYGESRAAPQLKNLRGKLVELRDQAGLVRTEDYDFKGNLLSSSRQLLALPDPQLQTDANFLRTIDWRVDQTFEPESFVTETRYDALNRPIQLIPPHSSKEGSRINVIQPGYNEANLLERLDVWLNFGSSPDQLLDKNANPRVGVNNIDYDAKGQRVRIDYKNGASTRYRYDPETLRLTSLYTFRGAAFTGDCDNPGLPPETVAAPAEPPPGLACGLQQLHYTYDPAGNISHIRDAAQQRIYFKNSVVDPSAEYTYDATSRLIKATGREHLGQAAKESIPHSYNDAPRTGLVHPNDGKAMGQYLESYVYDAVGNIVSMQHLGASGWARNFTYAEESQLDPSAKSNRLTSTGVESDPNGIREVYSTKTNSGYDEHGNMLRMPQLAAMQWNEFDQLRMTQRQVVNPADAEGAQRDGERTWYAYDAGGQRVRKVTVSASGQVKDERIYLGGFEVYRSHGPKDIVRETLHLMDDRQRIALVETRVQGEEPGIPQELTRYKFGNHLGSASLELDKDARILSYEEYTPYGSTAYQAVQSQVQTPKRYRYTGKERDEESGLYYHGARYFAPWIGRWTSCDPLGFIDGPNIYAYASNNPLRWVDLDGCDDAAPPDPTIHRQELEAKSDEELQQLLMPYAQYASAGHGDLMLKELAKGGREALINYFCGVYGGCETGTLSWKLEQARRLVGSGKEAVSDRWSRSKVGRTVAEWEETAKEAAHDIGADVVSRLDVTQGSTNQLYNEAPKYETPRHLGGEIGELGYSAAKEGAKTYLGGRAVEMGVGLAAAATVKVAESALKPIAIGLSRTFNHRENLVARFAEKVGATTYWQEYPGAIPSNNVILARMVAQFEQRAIKVNLSGLAQLPGRSPDIEKGLAAILGEPIGVTEGEIAHVLRNPKFFEKAEFFLNGEKILVDRDRVMELLK